MITLVLLSALFLGYLSAQNILFAFGAIGVFFCIAVLIICVLNPEAGLYISMTYSFFISHFNRLLFNDIIPVGVFSELLILAIFLGFFIRKVNLRESITEFTNHRVVIFFLLVWGYTLLEVFNPYGFSPKAWLPVYRKIFSIILLFFIAYTIFNTKTQIKRFITILFILCFFSGLYGCIQEWHGFFAFEEDWLRADELRFKMTYVNGGARKMSTMVDGLSYSIIMATCSVLFLGLVTGKLKNIYKAIILTGVLFMIMGMSFALTRTANVMLVGGIALFFVITFDRITTRLIVIPAAIVFLIALFGPIGNTHIGQFRNTFKGGTKDASFQVRETNRKRIQPYIYSHPFGGGLSTTGPEGLMYHPGHPLAGFPPDSGYLKQALEIGWIGFILILLLYFNVLKAGINGYFSTTNNESKIYYAAFTGACFALYIGNFSQVATGGMTDIVVYYPMIAIILKLKKIDQQPNPQVP